MVANSVDVVIIWVNLWLNSFSLIKYIWIRVTFCFSFYIFVKISHEIIVIGFNFRIQSMRMSTIFAIQFKFLVYFFLVKMNFRAKMMKLSFIECFFKTNNNSFLTVYFRIILLLSTLSPDWDNRPINVTQYFRINTKSVFDFADFWQRWKHKDTVNWYTLRTSRVKH